MSAVFDNNKPQEINEPLFNITIKDKKVQLSPKEVRELLKPKRTMAASRNMNFMMLQKPKPQVAPIDAEENEDFLILPHQDVIILPTALPEVNSLRRKTNPV